MTKKEFSYIVFSNTGENVEEIHGVYKDLEGATLELDQHYLLCFLNMEIKQRSYDVRSSPQKKQKNSMKMQNQKTSLKKQIAKMATVLYPHKKYHDKLQIN